MPDSERLPGVRGEVAAVPEQIEQHARTVDRLSERVTQAAHAGTHVSLDAAAYGQMCAFLPSLLSPLQERVVSVTRIASEALDQSAASLRTTAAAYVAVDGAAAGRIETAARRD
ncbi:type VII secretion target [Allorhizocola rhizosphaerae]|uniref:type VII secretion target n=1 Tax=Allorhizocola rhizosphaerae TaxID=1872709 RepID=UPI000E3D675C|nr:type VII secretion target [Allorhizocola rhizosphaerae]